LSISETLLKWLLAFGKRGPELKPGVDDSDPEGPPEKLTDVRHPSGSSRASRWETAAGRSFDVVSGHCRPAAARVLPNDRGPDLTPELAHARVADYIDHFYNPQKRHSTLDYFSLIEYTLKQIVRQ
jgi:hypothetical protein